MPLYNPPGLPAGAGAGPYVQGYSTSTSTLVSYTPNTQTAAFVGGLLDLLQAAKLSDLNTLRIAVENLRVFAESAAQQHNALVADLKTTGMIS